MASAGRPVIWQPARTLAGAQGYEVRYEPKKTGRQASAVKKAVKNTRKWVEKRLGR